MKREIKRMRQEKTNREKDETVTHMNVVSLLSRMQSLHCYFYPFLPLPLQIHSIGLTEMNDSTCPAPD